MRSNTPPEDHRFRPRICVWELTLACNLRCEHCGSSAGRPRRHELSTAEALSVVDQLADLECELITLSGGEPTLRGDWPLIAAAAERRGLAVNMVTNGTTVDAAMAKRIADSGLANVALSLDGLRRDHDRVRGVGTFDRTCRAAERLAAAGVSVSVISQANRRTLGELEALHDQVVALGAASWRVQLAKPTGNLRRRDPLLLLPRDLLVLLPRLALLKQRSPIWIDVGDSIGYFGPYERLLRRKRWGAMRPLWTGCQAGRFAVGIESDGGVKGCLSLQARLGRRGDPFREGSLRERTLEQIWFDLRSFAFNREPPALRGFCRRCAHASICRGGAKCVAAAFGDLSRNPYCYHQVKWRASRVDRYLRSMRRGAAVAVMIGALGGGAAGCGARAVPTEADSGLASDAALQHDALPDVLPDGEPCCQPEYGELPPDPCANVCCDCDYGLPPPPGCC